MWPKLITGLPAGAVVLIWMGMADAQAAPASANMRLPSGETGADTVGMTQYGGTPRQTP